MINLMVNGKPREADEAVDLATFLDSFGVKSQFVAVGYNGEVLKKGTYSEITLQEGDTLEIVRPVGGG